MTLCCQGLTSEEEKLLREKKVALAREKLVQESFKSAEDRPHAVLNPRSQESQWVVDGAGICWLHDNGLTSSDGAGKRRMCSLSQFRLLPLTPNCDGRFQLQEYEQENAKLAAEVKKIQEKAACAQTDGGGDEESTERTQRERVKRREEKRREEKRGEEKRREEKRREEKRREEKRGEERAEPEFRKRERGCQR
eukprot:Skav233953  [mRNA]  locus=scaffold1382:200509:203568:+ [translate_table: standard]